MPSFDVRCCFAPVLTLAAAVVFIGCNITDDVATPGESCDEEGATEGSLVCEDGTWVDTDLDAGFDVGDDDAGEDIEEDVPCEPESNEEFCTRLGAECGEVVENDNCGDARSVTCSEYGGFGCGGLGTCLLADDDEELESNICDCPDVDFDASDADICQELGAECADVDPGEFCVLWDDVEPVDCGECDGDKECGLADPNVCGCPCEIDDGCQADGDTAEENPCLICAPDESTEAFTELDDGTECDDNAICDAGACICSEGYDDCDGDCVDTDQNHSHCGECGDPCTTDVDGGEPVCDDGTCGVECLDDNETPCEDAGICADLDDDEAHCGECGNSCGANEVCDGGSCVCDSGYEECGDQCVDVDSSYDECNGVCVDTDADHDHCGGCDQGCEGIEVCDDGTCEENCPSGQTACDGACVDTDTDDDHCGSCDNDCPDDVSGASPTCDGGSCGYECDDSSDTLCESDGLCTDTDTDDEHCGTCGNDCGSDEFCSDGECVECTGDQHCDGDCESCSNDGECVDTDSLCSGTCSICSGGSCSDDNGLCADDEYCDGGSCECSNNCCADSDCDSDEHCSGGSCECSNDCCGDSDCGQDEVCSSGSCVDCATDGDCATGQTCVSNECVDCETDADCDDGSECTLNSCDNGSCVSQFGCPSPTPHCCSQECQELACD